MSWIYFTASIVGKKHYSSQYQIIVDELKNKADKVVSDHIMNSTESQIHMQTKKQRLEFQSKLEKWITSCDCMVAETSFPSISVGYEISIALSRNKPVLVLYNKQGKPPTLLVHHKDENLICEMYTVNQLPEIIEDFINYVKGTHDTRFTFYITSGIASYLEKVSKREKLPKSVYLRKLIEMDMKSRQ